MATAGSGGRSASGPLYRDQAIVLRTYKLGEADRIVVLLTQEHGKVRAVAKGMRKTKSRFGARLEPPGHVAIQLYRGRGELETVSQAESLDHFRTIRTSLDRLARAAALLEAVDQLTPDAEPNPRRYQMLLGALRTLDTRDPAALVGAFFWKVLAAEGFAPELDSCVNCGSPDDLVSFDVIDGGLRCRNCRKGPLIDDAALGLLRRILGGALNAALDEPESSATHDVEGLATAALEHHIERRLRSTNVLGRLG